MHIGSRLIKIDFLKNHPNTIPELAAIWHQLMGSPDSTAESVLAAFQQHLNDNQLPLTLVAFCDETPVGMCSLRDNDGVPSNLTPRLCSLVVHPDYQREGIAPQLINAIKQITKQLGFNQLYLSTPDPTLPNYYSRLGWLKIGVEQFKDRDMTIMGIIVE